MTIDERENQSGFAVSGDRQREQQRLNLLEQLGLLDNSSVPIFEEATQTVAHYLQVPICILGIIDREVEWLKAAFGLSRLGLMNDLAAQRSLPLPHSLNRQIVETRKKWLIPDLADDPELSQSFLHQEYGIHSYVGIPLIISEGDCIGALAVLDLQPHTFTPQEISYLEMTARWSLSEFERAHMLKIPSNQTGLVGVSVSPHSNRSLDPTPAPSGINSALASKNKLLNQLTQELRTPLTSVLGMAKMLNTETYGPLTPKQKEYMTIIYNSGQNLLSLINQILELAVLDEVTPPLKIKPVDVEMLCQQATNHLESLAERQNQQIRLSLEPGIRIWHVDKVLVQQILYHLIASVIEGAAEESTIRLHASHKQNELLFSVWITHPWLGEGIPNPDEVKHWFKQKMSSSQPSRETPDPQRWFSESDNVTDFPSSSRNAQQSLETPSSVKTKMQFLRLELSLSLAQLHGGRLELKGNHAANYRYIVRLKEDSASLGSG